MEVVFEMLCHQKCWHFALNHFTVIYVFYCGKNKLSNWDSQEDALCLLLSQSKCHVNTRFCSFMELQDTWYCWLFLPQTPPLSSSMVWLPSSYPTSPSNLHLLFEFLLCLPLFSDSDLLALYFYIQSMSEFFHSQGQLPQIYTSALI